MAASAFKVSFALNGLQSLPGARLNTEGHRLAVNDMVEVQTEANERLLFTGGRDSSIHSWAIHSSPLSATHLQSVSHHSHWVNRLAACSSNLDATVKLWKASSQVSEDSSAQVQVLEGHSDYVTCLEHPTNSQFLYSAGLDQNVFQWDIEHSLHPVHAEPHPLPHSHFLGSNQSSVYSLAATNDLVVSGGADRIIRGWDPRERTSTFKFRGHRDIVRELLIHRDGTKMISASSDCSIKVWDVGERRCIKTYSIHEDSVWTLAIDQTFTRLFSAGRDGNVFLTDLSTAESRLLIARDTPVLRIHLPEEESSLWLSTPRDGTIHHYTFDAVVGERRTGEYELCSSPGSPAMQMLSRAMSPSSFPPRLRPRTHEEELVDPMVPLLSDPALVILGRPGVIQHHILNDRIHILTQDSEDRIVLWNVLEARAVEDLGVGSWEEIIDKHFQLLSIPAWFRVDHSTGSPIVELDHAQCFAATMSHDMVKLPKPPAHVNAGQVALNTLFATWKAKRLEKFKSKSADSSAEEKTDEETPAPCESSDESSATPNKDTTVTEPSPVEPEIPAPLFPMAPDVEVMIVNTANGRILCQAPRQELDGTELLPRWVEDCVLRDQFTTRIENKYCFYIRPSGDDSLPALPSGDSKLSSLRWLTVSRICEYIKMRLKLTLPPVSQQEEKPKEELEDSTATEGKNEEEGEEKVTRVSPAEYLELLCQDQVLDPSLDLAAIKTFYWKSGGDMMLYYRRRAIFRQNDQELETEEEAPEASS